MANHGMPVLGSLIAAPFLLLTGALFTRSIVEYDDRPVRPAAARAAAVIVGGGILFMLPHEVSLPTPGYFWWHMNFERYAIYSTPYPFAAWLAFSWRDRRRVPLAVCAAAAGCLAIAWPTLLSGATALTATALRNEIGAPAVSLYAAEFPGVRVTDGYYTEDNAVSAGYTIDGHDIEVTVSPAEAVSPCADLGGTLFWDTPYPHTKGTDGTCDRLPNGRWQYSTQDDDHLTQVKRAGDYFIAVTADAKAESVQQLIQIFASLRHPTSKELVAVGHSQYRPGPLD